MGGRRQRGDARRAVAAPRPARTPAAGELSHRGCGVESPGSRASRQPGEGGPTLEHRELSLDPLTRPEAETLALTLLGRGDPAASLLAQTIARESGGNPFFVSELVRYFQAADGQTEHPITRGGTNLGDVLWDRIQRLPESRGVCWRSWPFPDSRSGGRRRAGRPDWGLMIGRR